jgi:transposase
MAIKHSEEFKQEAERIALTSGLPRSRTASDLRVGKSQHGTWVSDYRLTDMVSGQSTDFARENERLRREGLGIMAPVPVPHPNDIFIDLISDNIEVEGPMNDKRGRALSAHDKGAGRRVTCRLKTSTYPRPTTQNAKRKTQNALAG